MVDSPPRYLDEKSWDEMISEQALKLNSKKKLIWFFDFLPPFENPLRRGFFYKWHPILHFYSKRKESLLLLNEEQRMID